jgi:hypothetical protein
MSKISSGVETRSLSPATIPIGTYDFIMSSS